MHRTRATLVAALFLSVAFAAESNAQNERVVRRTPRAFIVISDGIAANTGGSPIGGSGLNQLFRIAGVLQVKGGHGVELSAFRSQELLPASTRFSDPQASPEADGVILSYASLDRPRLGGFPAVFSIGGGVATRPTADPAVKTTKWVGQVGFESDLLKLPVNWADFAAGGRVFVLPGGAGRKVFLAALTFGLRIG